MTPTEPNNDRQHLTDHTLDLDDGHVSGVMYIRFQDGSLYSFAGVEKKRCWDLISSPSPGRFLAKHFNPGRRVWQAEVDSKPELQALEFATVKSSNVAAVAFEPLP